MGSTSLGRRCFRHELLLSRPYLLLTKGLDKIFTTKEVASVIIACKYMRDCSLSPIHQQLMTEAPGVSLSMRYTF